MPDDVSDSYLLPRYCRRISFVLTQLSFRSDTNTLAQAAHERSADARLIGRAARLRSRSEPNLRPRGCPHNVVLVASEYVA
eukprot:1880217-Pleurochrysis_carterae.AAC.1